MITLKQKRKIAKSSQEQAVASWINYLNQIRLNEKMAELQIQDHNLEKALGIIDNTFKTINNDIIIRNRGGKDGMHGFIAEVAEVGVGNARNAVKGERYTYKWINDNGPDDLIHNGIKIQQKFVNAGNHLSLQAVKKHFEAYPDYLKNGKKYQIPLDHYEKIQKLMSISKEQAEKMPTDTGEFSLKQWKEVHEFFEKGDIKMSDIEPSQLTYKQVQRGTIKETLDKEKRSLRKTDSKIREHVAERHKPTVQEGIKATAASAVIEGGLTFSSAIISKIRSGKSIKDFTEDDWLEILKDSGVSFAKGGIRGASIYALTNYVAAPASVANSLVTASFGVAQQAYLFKNGKISADDFLLNSETLCVDVTVSALSSFIGQAVIPVPVLGAVIGNSVGMMVYETAKDSLKRKERLTLEAYVKEVKQLEKKLDKEYKVYVNKLNAELDIFFDCLGKAFAFDYDDALEGSIALARFVGVPENEIPKTIDEIDSYFLS